MPRQTIGNPTLPGGVERYGRSKMYKRSLKYKRTKVAVAAVKPKVQLTKVKKIGGDKNGGERTVPIRKPNRYVFNVDVKKPLKTRKTARPMKLRSSITPGTILIILAGPFRGRRVVFLKSLESGLLLVTGPFNVNGVPLRRVNQAYVIATSKQVDVSGVKLADNINDAFFAKSKSASSAADFTEGEEKPKKVVSEEKKAAQKAVDAQLAGQFKDAVLRKYMQSYFTLTKGMYPHNLKF